MKKEDIMGKTPKEIKGLYALPAEPTYISNVNLPRNTKMRVGFAGKNKFSPDGGGGLQYEILDKLNENWYGSAQQLGG